MANTKDREEPAVLAHQCFIKKDYASALHHLKELEGLIGTNNKRVQHNKAVVEFFLEDMKNVSKFKKAIAQQTGQSFPDIELKDSLSPFVVYNYAVVLYHSRYYYQTVVILEKLLTLKNIKDPRLFQQVILLLLEATLCRRTYEKTLEIAKTHGDKVKINPDISDLFERLVSRAQLMVGQKNKLNLKPDTIENVFVLAQQTYLNDDVKEAANMLGIYKTMKYNYDLKTQGEDIWAAVNNNLGLIYLTIKKPYLSTKYFQHAVKEHFRALDSEDGDRLIVCKERPMYIYNLGLALFASNNFAGSFECFVEAARHYPSNPAIWIHLAECCIKKCCNDEATQYTLKKLGSGPHTRVLLSKETNEHFSNSPVESFSMPSLSLEFAVLCLRNSEFLLTSQEPPDDEDIPSIQAPPGPPISWKKRCILKNSTFVLRSYILLHLQDPVQALTSANQLLKQTDATNAHKAWAHIYAAEALINLDRITEAVEHLHPPMIHDLVSNLPYQTRDMIAVSVWAKAAVCHILRGDLVTARKILLQINSLKVLPLQMYLEVCTGNIENCQTILRKLRMNKKSH